MMMLSSVVYMPEEALIDYDKHSLQKKYLQEYLFLSLHLSVSKQKSFHKLFSRCTFFGAG